MKTQLSSELEITAYRASYDRCCKNLLAHKEILAHILKECVSEFKDCDLSYIADNCIESKPEISEVAVHRGTPSGSKIIGDNTEDKTIDEGVVYFDIRFVAQLPQTGESIRLIINLEAQNQYNTDYPLVRRGLYYCCRLISAQYETEFTGDKYGLIKKVYSIWICTNTPKYARNTITRYKITEENMVGIMREKPENYDLLNVIMVCLDGDGENAGENSTGILKLLRVLLSNKLTANKKKVVLNDDFGIKSEVIVEKEVDSMCNLSQGVWEDGIDNGKLEIITNFMKKMNFTFEQAADFLGLSDSDKQRYADKV